MTSTPGAPRPVGSVVDPAVRDDGGQEPALVLLERQEAPPAEPPASDSTGLPPVRGAQLRERLRARAAAGRASPGGQPGLGDDLDAPSGSVELDAELWEERSPPRRPPPVGLGPGRLSPEVTAVLGALAGVAAVVSLVALAMQFDRHPGRDGARLTQAPRPTASASAAPAPEEAPRRVRERLPGPWRVTDDTTGLSRVKGRVGTSAFLKALTETGIDLKQAYRIHTALSKVRSLDRCNRTDEFVVLLDRNKVVRAFEFIVSPEEVYQGKEGADGLLSAARLDLAVQRAQVTGTVQVDGDLAASVERAGLERALAATLRKALSGFLSVDALERGDTLRVVAQEVTVLGEFARYAGIEAVEVRSKGSERPLRVYYFQGKSERGYYDAEGRSPFEGGWRRPIKDAPITSRFNPKRLHPVLKKVMPHNGTDFGAPTGTPVGASSYGTVSFVGFQGPSGNLVLIEHPGGYETGYAHLSRFAEGLKVGDKVKRLQIIGYVGSTGRSTGPHLHFSARKNGVFIDPESLSLDAMRVLPREERELFAAVRARYDALLDALPLPVAPPAEPAPSASAAPAGDPDEPEPDLGAAPTAAGGAPPRSAPATAPAGSPGSAIFLTDKDLLRVQPLTDDGESDD